MPEMKQEGLEGSYKRRKQEARKKASAAITELISNGDAVNFSSVQKLSGISRSFLYGDKELRTLIESQRARNVDSEMNRRAKYDKTARSKDVIIEAKNKRIAALEAENKRLQNELNALRAALYKQM